MSSTPVTPRTRSESQDGDSPPLSSPASSPPSIPQSEDEKKEDADYDPKAEAAMRKEEERLVKESQRKQDRSSKKPNWNAEDQKKNYDKLDWFMSQSKVSSLTPVYP